MAHGPYKPAMAFTRAVKPFNGLRGHDFADFAAEEAVC